ncbi:DMT family transporter [Sporolactobacillus laevolacticus]|uniref:DMT family transporter n=1 Tax=Sporolactobacillus laevolacticus TaxID=33018 RepID=UPI0025B5E965|nr:DMT family transporter [Sporolactobacillus laevolacticus]MDN3955137.1 DMT family transporter [Sporolactobacillus laevolacticus]
MKKYQAVSFLVLANLFWAGNYVFGKYVVSEMTPIQMTFVRWLLAVLILFPLAQVLEKPKWGQVWKRWKILLIMSLLGIVGYNVLLYEALRFTTSLNAALVNSINPAVIAIFAVWFLKEKLSVTNSLGLVISLFGVLLVLTHGALLQIFTIHYNQGDLLMLLAITVWTFYTLIGKKLGNVPPIAATAVSATLGLIVLLPFFLTSGFSCRLSQTATIGIIYIVLFPSVCSFVFWNSAIRVIGASKAGIYLNMLTVFTALISLILGKPITLPQIMGGVLVIIGVYLTNRKSIVKTEAKVSA